MTRRNDWFVKINQALKNKVKFVDDDILVVDGISDVSDKRKNDEYSLINGVLYIPRIKCNLLTFKHWSIS